MISTDSEDDDDDDDERYDKQKVLALFFVSHAEPFLKIMSLNDRGSTIKAIGTKKVIQCSSLKHIQPSSAPSHSFLPRMLTCPMPRKNFKCWAFPQR